MQCTLCPVGCKADRTVFAGRCGTRGLTVAKYYLHPYEEPPISHKNGSGTVFFGGCSLKCVFCQNYELSRAERGKAVSPEELAEIFRKLEDAGADNINLVTPDHVSDLIAEALALYRPRVPVVYNSSGYAKKEALESIAPFVDVWLPDLKFYSSALSLRYTGREDYFLYASEAVKYMARKPVAFDGDGKLLTGIVVRHLVLPGCTSDSLRVLDFLKEVLPENAPISLMRQYTPFGNPDGYPELNRRVTAREYGRVLDHARACGFKTIYAQEKDCAEESFIPAWDF